MVNREKPTKNWLPFPTVGTKGLPTALSQTWCNDDSISVGVICSGVAMDGLGVVYCLGAGWVLVDAQEWMDVSLEMELGFVSLFAAAAYLASTDESG
jgi:hypothetical protein